MGMLILLGQQQLLTRTIEKSRSVILRSLSSGQKADDTVSGDYDLIGPPRPVSNLRPVKFAVRHEESELELRLRRLRSDTQNFNEEWWSNHNKEFKEGRSEYIKNILKAKYKDQPDKTTISAEEMSVFYKDFMNRRWAAHVDYNKEWQIRNWTIIFLTARVWLENLFRRSS